MPQVTKRLLLASSNPAKVREYQSLLRGLPFPLTTLAEEKIKVRVEETGTSLEENATLKAKTYARLAGMLTLTDDSGLEVDALGGEPGPMSRRHAGEDASDQKRISLLLARLVGVPWEKRTATFRCVIAVATPAGEVELTSGECRGLIALEPRGTNGFGYDPIFHLPELGKSMAELTLAQKNKLSHRGKAAQRARRILGHFGRGVEG